MGRGQGLEARVYFQGCSPMCKGPGFRGTTSKGQGLEARVYFQGCGGCRVQARGKSVLPRVWWV